MLELLENCENGPDPGLRSWYVFIPVNPRLPGWQVRHKELLEGAGTGPGRARLSKA